MRSESETTARYVRLPVNPDALKKFEADIKKKLQPDSRARMEELIRLHEQRVQNLKNRKRASN